MPEVKDKLYSFEDYLNYDDGTNHRYELVDGRLEIVNPPTFRHLLVAKYLERCLDREIERLDLPWLCLKEAGIRTGWRKSRLSDLYVLPIDAVEEFLDRSAISQTPPLLVIEIVSPESVTRDYRYKRSEYAALGIPEYWIVNPIDSSISILFLEEGLYEETVFTGNQSIISRIFPEISLKVDRVLLAGKMSES
ncbi:MAG: Uma2 family endonuclease [Cyanobacteriota bacterium]|nr:Uma2 family endonuclease [Cyanobacteriota bacterium]